MTSSTPVIWRVKEEEQEYVSEINFLVFAHYLHLKPRGRVIPNLLRSLLATTNPVYNKDYAVQTESYGEYCNLRCGEYYPIGHKVRVERNRLEEKDLIALGLILNRVESDWRWEIRRLATNFEKHGNSRGLGKIVTEILEYRDDVLHPDTRRELVIMLREVCAIGLRTNDLWARIKVSAPRRKIEERVSSLKRIENVQNNKVCDESSLFFWIN